MKKLSIILAVTMLLSLLSVFPTVSFAETATAGSTSGISVWDGTIPEAASGKYDGGSGTATDPYLISSAAALVQLAVNTNSQDNGNGLDNTNTKCYKLTTDIALNANYENYLNWATAAPSNKWSPISNGSYDTGKKDDKGNPIMKDRIFEGTIDGDGHTIYGMYVNENGGKAGFFGKLKGTVKNLAFENCYVQNSLSSGTFAGIVCGCLGDNGASITPTVNNVQIKNSYVASFRGAGLVAGQGFNGTISNVFVSGTIGGGRSGEVDMGGLVGWYNSSSYCTAYITNAIALPTFNLVSGSGTYGSILGNNTAKLTTFTNVYFDSSITGQSKGVGYGGAAGTLEGSATDTTISTLTVANAKFDTAYWSDSANGPVLKSFVKAEEKPVEPTRPVSVWDGVTPRNEDGYKLSGSGTETDPYLIQNANDLAFFARYTNNGGNYAAGTYVKLTTDIVINADHANYMNWSTTAPSRSLPSISKTGKSFKGTFDGDGHIIYGAYYSDNYANGFNSTMPDPKDSSKTVDMQYNSGFFGQLEGTVKNLGFVHCVSVRVGSNTVGSGIITGHLGRSGNSAKAVIENCFVENSYVSASRAAGLLAGYCVNANVKNCYTTGIVVGGVSGESDMGGLLGYTNGQKVTVSGVYSLATFSLVSGSGTNGSLIGNCNPAESTVEKAYYNSNISKLNGIGYAKNPDTQITTDLKGKAFDLSNMALDKNVWRDSANGPVLITFAGPAGEIVERSVSVGDSYAVNFVVDTNVDGTWTMDFTCGNKTTTAEPVETDDGTEFRISGINPQQMTATIKAELKLDGKVVDTKETTLKDYFIALYEQTDDDNVKTFLADTLAYGDAAQAFCGLTPDTMKDIEWQTSTFNAEDVTSVRSGSGAVKAAGLVLSDYNYIYFRFTKDATSFKILCNDVLVEECLDIASRCTDVTVNSVVYNKVMTSALKATEGDAKYTIQVFNGDELIGTATYSVYSYVAAMYDCGTAALENIVKTLFNYCRSAAAVSAK